jgi:hypothetical protein
MAAALVALEALLVRMGLSAAAAGHLTQVEGVDQLSELATLRDEDVERLCKVTRRPGGTIANPAGGGQVPNPGIPVSMLAEKNLKQLCYYLRYQVRVSRTVAAADIDLDDVRAYEAYENWEKTHEDAEAPKINEKDWPRTIEAIEGWLRGCLGQTKIPLAYVIRADIAVPDEDDDDADDYASYQDELIRRAPIQHEMNDDTFTFDPVYKSDRERVWELIDKLTRDHNSHTYVRPARKTRDGRLAFLGLKSHFLGVNNVDNMSSAAEAKLKSTTYKGETRQWNFEKYVKVHVDQYAILEGLKEHGYSGLDPRSRVRHLMAGIHTNKLDAVKNQILASPEMRVDFDRVVNLYQDSIEQTKHDQGRDITIAAVSTEDDNVVPDMSVPDRYYKVDEYKKLTTAQKKGLRAKRKKRADRSAGGGRSQKGGRGGGGGGSETMKLDKRSIKALATAMTAAAKKEKKKDEDETDSTSDDSSVEEQAKKKKSKTTTNRNNPALKRK